MRRSLFVLAYSGFLSASWAAQPALLAQLWDLLGSWGPSAIDAGCIMDPNGACQPRTQEGCGMDPNGTCHPPAQLQTDEGCIMDPNGSCRPAQQIDAGCGMDPNGRPKGS